MLWRRAVDWEPGKGKGRSHLDALAGERGAALDVPGAVADGCQSERGRQQRLVRRRRQVLLVREHLQ